jgi:hypothetical protein
VVDNLYFIGTKIHSARAITGGEGMIVIEALFDYAANDAWAGNAFQWWQSLAWQPRRAAARKSSDKS